MSNPRVIISHGGKQHAYHAAKALLDLCYLHSFHTSSYIRSPEVQQWLIDRGETFWTRRFLHGLGSSRVHPNWRFELKELLYARLYGRSGKVNRAVMERDRKFDRYMARRLKSQDADIFWGFQGSCLESLKSAKARGMKTVVELATAHYPASEEILLEEKQLHPEWADSIVYAGFPEWYQERLAAEPVEADHVFAASQFTIKTLRRAGIPEEKLVLLPLGFDVLKIPYDEKAFEPYKDRPLRLLFAGRISQMKGVKYLLEAVKALNTKQVELHFVGFIQGSGQALKPYSKYFTLHPHISQQALFNRYKDFDVLVLPSIYEGFGLVIVEAMAAGLPVITTDHTIGPELIENNTSGYLIPIRDIVAIKEAIGKLQSNTADEMMAMRRAARSAAMNYTWDRYRERLKVVLDKTILKND